MNTTNRTVGTRNTPTGVGKTKPVSKQQPFIKKHPHGRGKDLSKSDGRARGLETPPRAWGRRCRWCQGKACCRNTPTGVGKTRGWCRGACPSRKHPHGRGEDDPTVIQFRRNQETPPRAWGRQSFPFDLSQSLRNTPTGVGKTRLLAVSQPRLRKHPHGRGEDTTTSYFPTDRSETPPRAWGRHCSIYAQK